MQFNFFNMDKTKMIRPTTKVYRKEIVEGYSIPAFIHNGAHFFVDIDVYENGRVECWNFEDFEHFVRDVQRGWVSLSVPDNKAISIHGLGGWIVGDGNWIFNEETFIAYVESLIAELNPKFENMYTYTEKIINGVRIGESGNGTVYKEKKSYPFDIFPEKINGQSLNLFYKTSDDFHLVRVNVFPDATIRLSRLENPLELTMSEFENLIREGVVVSEIPLHTNISIYGLGSFKALEVQYVNSVQDKLLEMKDMVRELNGQPSSIEICRKDLESYRSNPSVENKNKLKMSYENIPDHQRMYVGDMDTKDVEVRMIIYGENEIENWSHYQVAKSLGDSLPSIQIPKPNDEEGN